MCTLQMIKLFYLETSVTEAFLSCQSILQIQGVTSSFVRLLVNKRRIVSIKVPAIGVQLHYFFNVHMNFKQQKILHEHYTSFWKLLLVKLHFIAESRIFSCAFMDIPKSTVIRKSLIHFCVLTSYYLVKRIIRINYWLSFLLLLPVDNH